MNGFAYNAKAAAAASVTTPTGWPSEWTWPGTPWPPGWKPVQGGATWSRTYNLSSTSGAIALLWITPHGNFTLSTAEADSASIKTSTLGGLTFTYSGYGGYAGRGTITITGTGSYADRNNPGGGFYSYSQTVASGSVLVTGTVTVNTGGVKYTSSGEGYSNQLLAAATSIAPLTTLNTPVTFRSPS